MSNNHQDSYRQIFKSTSLFGGVEAYNILITIIKSKMVALLLGPTGMGISGLLISTTSFIGSLTNFGLERSCVKNIASINQTGNSKRISEVVTIVRRLVWLTGSLGAIATLLLSSYLSKITFGSEKYTYAFIWLSITLLLNQLSAGQKAILRSTRQLRFMAQSSLWGSTLGLCTSIPMYYIWGIDGIVPAIIAFSAIKLVLSTYYSKKIPLQKIKIPKNIFVQESKGLLHLGFMLSLSSFVVLGTSYAIKVFIRTTGNLEDVGLYNAGFAIISTYFGLFFTSLTTDYYPRLAGVAHDNEKAKELMNQQCEMSTLIISPVLTLFLIFINFVIIALYSQKFLPINEMILWSALGIYFKAASWSVGIIFISKGSAKTLFLTELSSNIILLVLSFIGYHYYSLTGLGVAFLLYYIFAFLQTYLVAKIKYSFSFSKQFFIIFISQLTLGVLAFIVVKAIGGYLQYLLGSIIILSSLLLSLIKINHRVQLKNIVKQRFHKLLRHAK